MAIANGTLPRLDSSPYDNPANFVATWDAAMDLIEANLGGGSGTDANALWFYKTGRTITSPLPTVAPSPALGVYLPEGFQWFQDGVMITLDEDTFVGDLPANFDGYAVLKATADGDNWIWIIESTSEDKSTFVGGVGVIGHVITDASGLTSIGTEVADADIVFDMPSIAALLGGANSGGSAITMLAQLIYNSADPRNAVTVIEEKLAAILVQALAAAATGGIIPSTTETDTIWTWLLNQRNITGNATPSLLALQLGSGAQPGLYGTLSSPETEQFDEGGTLTDIPSERDYDSR